MDTKGSREGEREMNKNVSYKQVDREPLWADGYIEARFVERRHVLLERMEKHIAMAAKKVLFVPPPHHVRDPKGTESYLYTTMEPKV